MFDISNSRYYLDVLKKVQRQLVTFQTEQQQVSSISNATLFAAKDAGLLKECDIIIDQDKRRFKRKVMKEN